MSNNKQTRQTRKQQQQQQAKAAEPQLSADKPATAQHEQVTVAPTDGDKIDGVMAGLTKALEGGNITSEQFDEFVARLDISTKKEEVVELDDYPTTIRALMDIYEKRLPINTLQQRDMTVRAQRSLWGIISTAINQEDYEMFKVGYRTIISRMARHPNYTIQHLYRGLANPMDPTPVLEEYTLRLYNLMLTTAQRGVKGTLGQLSLDEQLEGMPEQVRDNLVEFYSS